MNQEDLQESLKECLALTSSVKAPACTRKGRWDVEGWLASFWLTNPADSFKHTWGNAEFCISPSSRPVPSGSQCHLSLLLMSPLRAEEDLTKTPSHVCHVPSKP